MEDPTKQESQLVLDCQNGQLNQFTDLYHAYFEPISKFVFYKTMNKEAAEDITSDIFLKALRKINTFDQSKSSFKTWLYTIARNTIIDFYRSHKPTSNIEDVWDLDVFESDTVSPTAILDQKISHEQLHQVLKNLPSQTREILTFRFWQGLSWQEIAELTGKSKASLKMKTSRALADLGKNFSLFAILPYLLKF